MHAPVVQHITAPRSHSFFVWARASEKRSVFLTEICGEKDHHLEVRRNSGAPGETEQPRCPHLHSKEELRNVPQHDVWMTVGSGTKL